MFDDWGNPIPVNPAVQRRNQCYNLARNLWGYDTAGVPINYKDVIAVAKEIEAFLYETTETANA